MSENAREVVYYRSTPDEQTVTITVKAYRELMRRSEIYEHERAEKLKSAYKSELDRYLYQLDAETMEAL